MSVQNHEVVQRWLDHLIQHNKPPEKNISGGTVYVQDGVLIYRRPNRSIYNHRRDRVYDDVLAEYVPRSRLVLLNGNGFQDQYMTQWQTYTRVRSQQLGDEVKVAVIPFAALIAAGIERETMRALFVRQDENELTFTEVPGPPPVNLDKIGEEGEWELVQDGHSSKLYRIEHEGQRYECMFPEVNVYTNKETGEKLFGRAPQDYYYPGVRDKWESTREWTDGPHVQYFRDRAHVNANFLIRMTEEELEVRKGRVRENNEGVARGDTWRGGYVRAVWPEPDGKFYTENTVHHLGACLFSAVGEDGKRHKYLSAFDEEEAAGAMYYLAQLPDGSGASTYDEAIHALAPPIVHEARKQGRTVRRQGDVFAIETNLTDDDVYAMARTRVRRNVALFGHNPETGTVHQVDMTQAPTILPGEVSQTHECPCCHGIRFKVGWGPKAHRALMIYNTGHTATEVVKTKTGMVYIKGTMYHDPWIEEEGRRREHRNVELAADKWHIAVRNTVPRRRRRIEQGEEVTA